MTRLATLDQYNTFCAALPHTAHVVQWGGAHVWKVGGASGKVFAIGGWAKGCDQLAVTFKVTPLSYELLKDLPGVRPAPYLASRGMSWVQRVSPESLDDAALCDYVATSHGLAAAGLTKRRQIELGLLAPPSQEVRRTQSAIAPRRTTTAHAAPSSSPRGARP